MLIVGLSGGLGNQMFEYEIYLALKARRDDVAISDYWYRHALKKNPVAHERACALPNIFDLSGATYAADADVEALADIGGGRLGDIRRGKLKLYKRTHVNVYNLAHCGHVYDESRPIPWLTHTLIPGTARMLRRKITGRYPSKPLDYKRQLIARHLDEITAMESAYLNGFWVNFDYTRDIEEAVRRAFRFTEPLDERNAQAARAMAGETSVSVHIRRGDLVGSNHTAQSTGYYQNAMEHFTQRHEAVHFWVFSDDIPWCRENLPAANMTFVDWNTGDDSWRDMQLMSLCKHNIITNSTFSAWGAWLNANPNKMVIRPKRYFVDGNEEPYPAEWLVMDN